MAHQIHLKAVKEETTGLPKIRHTKATVDSQAPVPCLTRRDKDCHRFEIRNSNREPMIQPANPEHTSETVFEIILF